MTMNTVGIIGGIVIYLACGLTFLDPQLLGDIAEVINK